MPQGFFSSMPNRVMGTLVLVALFIALSAFASLTFKQSKHITDINPSMISVTGTGDVTAKQISPSSHSLSGPRGWKQKLRKINQPHQLTL